MDSYDAYLSELREQIDVDRETRLLVLDVAATIEMELSAIVANYLAGGSVERQRVVERNISRWGGLQNLISVIRDALAEHDALTATDRKHIEAIDVLFGMRNLIAHGRVETWHANHPEIRDDQLGRTIYKRSRSGEMSWEWISFEDAQRKAHVANGATASLGRRLASCLGGASL